MAARSSISRCTALAISTGWSSDLNARAKAPSTIPSSLRSKLCRTPTGYPLSLLVLARIRSYRRHGIACGRANLTHCPGRGAERQTRTGQVRGSERTGGFQSLLAHFSVTVRSSRPGEVAGRSLGIQRVSCRRSGEGSGESTCYLRNHRAGPGTIEDVPELPE